MTNKVYSIILPGFSYKADGPVWVDKIRISATLNNIPVNIYDISTEESVTVAALKELTPQSEIEITSFKTFKLDDTFIILNSTSSCLNIFNNEANSGQGLCAVEFTGNYTDVVIFTIDLYTNSNWVKDDLNTASVNSDKPQYVHLKTIKLKYNPFITFTLPPKITIPDFIEADNTTTFSPNVNGIPSTLTVTGSKNVLLDLGISLNPDYDNLPEVPITSTVMKRCLKNLSKNTLLDTLDQKLNCDKYYLLLFNHNLPAKFGNNSATYDHLAIGAYRKSIDGSSGRLRYTIVGVSYDNLPIADVSWTKSVEYDLTDFVKSVKYYSSQQFSVGILATLTNPTILITCPTELYTVSGTTYSLQSGCMWYPIVSASQMSAGNFWDVWRDYSTLESVVWTHENNRGQSFPTTVTTPSASPKLVGTTSSTVSSLSTKLKNSMNLQVIVDSLQNVNYLTFIDTSYGKKKFSDLVGATSLLAHPVENGYIQVVHANTTLTPNLTIGISTNVSNVPTTSNSSLCPYVGLTASNTQGAVFSYPVVDSADGGVLVTEIIPVETDKISVCNSTGTNYTEKPLYTPNKSCWLASNSPFYRLEKNDSLTITIAGLADKTIKYLQLPEDPAKLSANSLSLSTSFVALDNNGSVTITNTFDYPTIIGSIGLIDTRIDQISSIGLKHSVGCYEDSTIFSHTFKCYYFPPDNTFCVGFYKVTADTTITKDSVVMLYDDTPQKNEIILNLLVGFLYKKASI